jgi:threonine dehydrogenase-like Zn-dependent dehydrogenase
MSGPIRAAVMPAPRQPIEVRDFPAPVLEPGAALLETLASEVCGTDVHLRHGRLDGVPYPIIPGHVSVGRIAALVPPLADEEGRPFREGDVVTFLDVHGSCGTCWYCLVAKETTRCPRRRVYGITYGAGDGVLGGWAERIWIRPGVRLLRLPDGLEPRTFIGGGCGAVTAWHAVRRGGVRLGDSVVVLGSGPVGQSAIAFAALSGAAPVIAVGAPDDRLAMARRMGADAALSIESLDPAGRRASIASLTSGRGADVVIEATGDPAAVPEGAALCRDGGVLVVAGHYTDSGDAILNPHALINRKHLEVRGCWGSDFSHFHGAIRAMARHHGHVPWGDLVQRWFSLEGAGEALAAVAARRLLKAGISPAGVAPAGTAPIRKSPPT